jgi:hypothetical protein
MQLSVPDPSVRELGREQITQIEIVIAMPDGSEHQTKVYLSSTNIYFTHLALGTYRKYVE